MPSSSDTSTDDEQQNDGAGEPAPLSHSQVRTNGVVGWRNGNASVSGAEDSGFESQACRFLFSSFFLALPLNLGQHLRLNQHFLHKITKSFVLTQSDKHKFGREN
jgi:hypothetical protein